ncbi:MAG: alpha-L-rhamnosidase [Mucilaginibacter sp.]|nr:alpha-L-rhamnosidase [Mucilaginibacter sp.]
MLSYLTSKLRFSISFAAVIYLFIANAYSSAAPKISGLQCEYLISPLGIDSQHPRLSWMLNDIRHGAIQTAWQLSVSTDSVLVKEGNAWQTNKTSSNISRVTYKGTPLQAFTKYYWQVTVWDKDGKSIVSPVASFETGLMDKNNWKGTWISDDNGISVKPAPYFRSVFTVNKKIKSARAYIAAGGLFELYLNDQKIGNHRLDPMYTRFDRRNLYVSFDVTRQLQSGKNAIGVLLGNGWYNHQSTAVWFFDKAPWRNRPTFCLDLRITYEDGNTETITSNKNWKTALSPIVFNSIYTAEHYDARLEQPGWNTVNFTDSLWKPVTLRQAPAMNIVSQTMQPIRDVEKIPAESMKKFDDETYVFNLGRNISGVSQITVRGQAGTVIQLKHAERLNKDGHADQSNIDMHYRPTDDKDPYQTDIFILSGKGEETFKPRFNYKGFQYVEVSSDKPVSLTKESLVGYFMHSDIAATGKINTSDNTVNKIWQATNNSYLSNFFGYPTDCPHREKNGWTGDAHIASETGLYNFDGITVYEKWMADHRDEQQPNGVLPSIIPSNGWGYEWGNGPDWTSTVAIIPWNLYLFYGDSKALADNYDNIKRYVNHINELYPTGLTTWGLGDWVPVKSVSPVELTSTAYYFTDVTILAKAAKLFHKTSDAAKYCALAQKIKDAFNAKYLNRETGMYDKGYQTELCVPLFWGLVPDELKSKVAANLAERVKQDNYHLDVGILGTKAMLSALSDNGYPEVAYAIASQETYPSWGWWIVNGANTLYENWKIDSKSDISLNHIMFGEIGAWLYKGIGGIKPDEKKAGFKNVILTPNFIKDLDHYESEHDGPFGKILSSWKRVGANIAYHVVIPANSTARLTFPELNGKKVYIDDKAISMSGTLHLISGTYDFVIR